MNTTREVVDWGMRRTDDPLSAWPSRDKDTPIPAYCPRCGRVTSIRRWLTVDKDSAYIYVACDGWMPAWISQLFSITTSGHWSMTIAHATGIRDYDPLTGARE